VAEVRRHLLGRGVDDRDADGAIAELGEQGYLDDDRYARRFIEDRRSLDGWGSERIERALARHGIEPELIARELAGRPAQEELTAAVEVLRRRLGTAPVDGRGRQRALGLLVRRGYELELAHDALRRFERA